MSMQTGHQNAGFSVIHSEGYCYIWMRWGVGLGAPAVIRMEFLPEGTLGDSKVCPYCGEEILAVAIRCKHCHSDLGSGVDANSDSITPASFKKIEYMDEVTAEKFLEKKSGGGIGAIGALILVVASGLYAYPLLNEDTYSACSALESKGAAVAVQRSSGQSDASGAIWTGVFANALKRMSDGAVAQTLIKAKYPDLPSGLACTVAYYQLMQNPKAFDDQLTSQSAENVPNSASDNGSSVANTIGSAATNTSQPQYVGGKYHRADPASDMTITRKGDLLHIVLYGAGPDLGENTPGDCQLEADGRLINDQIKASIIPFNTNDNEVSADDLKTNPGIVTVKLKPSGATVTEATVDGFCGRHSDLTGEYASVP